MKKHSFVSIILLHLVIISLFFIGTSVAASTELDGLQTTATQWIQSTSLPTSTSDVITSVVTDGRLYALALGNPRIGVYYSEIQSDSSIGNWIPTTPLPDSRDGPDAVAYNGKIYLFGGIGSGGEKSDVFFSTILDDGSLSAWQSTTSLPSPLDPNDAIAWDGKVYVLGGWGGPSGGWVDDILYADINEDGTLGEWLTTTKLPEPRHNMRGVVHDGVIYTIAGEYGHAANLRDTVYYSQSTCLAVSDMPHKHRPHHKTYKHRICMDIL